MMYKTSVRTSQEIFSVSIATTNRLMLCREVIAVSCENYMKYVNKLCGEMQRF
jgi:translation initiation factor IF-1